MRRSAERGGGQRRIGERGAEAAAQLLDIVIRCPGAGDEGHARRGRRRGQDPCAAQLVPSLVGDQRMRDAIDRAGIRLSRRDAADAGAVGAGRDDLPKERRRVLAHGQHVPPDVIARIRARAVDGQPAAPQVGNGLRAGVLPHNDMRPVAGTVAAGRVVAGRGDELHRRPEDVDEGIAAGLAEEQRGRAPMTVIVVRPRQRVGNALHALIPQVPGEANPPALRRGTNLVLAVHRQAGKPRLGSHRLRGDRAASGRISR